MGNKTIYKTCKDLCEKNDRESINELLGIYLESGKSLQKTARKYLKWVKNRTLLIQIIEEYLAREDSALVFLLLRLGMDLSRSVFLGRYLRFIKAQANEVQLQRFYKEIGRNNLTKEEITIVSDYIVNETDFDSQLIAHIPQNSRTPIFNAIVDFVAEKGIDARLLKILAQDSNYIDLLQQEIRSAITEHPSNNVGLAKYLDFSIHENIDVLKNYRIFTIYNIIANSYYKISLDDSENQIIRICSRVKNRKELNAGDWEYLSHLVKSDINNSHYYDLLFALAYIDKPFVISVFNEIYKNDNSNSVQKYLIKLESGSLFEEMIANMKASRDRKERYGYAVRALLKYPDNGTTIVQEAAVLEDDRLLLTLRQVAEKHNNTLTMNKIDEILNGRLDREYYQRYVVCPYDTNKVNCQKVIRIRRKNDNAIMHIPIYECSSCKKKYTVSDYWDDFSLIRVNKESVINLLSDAQRIAYSRPKPVLSPYIDNRKKKRYTSIELVKGFNKKTCIACNRKKKEYCVDCENMRLISGDFLAVSKKHKQYKIPFSMCPNCGLLFIQYTDYIGHEDVFECRNKEELMRFLIEAQNKKINSIQNTTQAVNSPAVTVKRKTADNSEFRSKTVAETENKKSLEKFAEDTKRKKRAKSDIKVIQIKDFVVRRNVFKCMYNDHRLINVDAAIEVITDKGKIIKTTVAAGYCSDCNTYFIMESTFQNLKKKGTPLCRISDEKAYVKGSSNINGMKLASESLLMQYGYTVSQTEGLSMTRRHKILALIIDNKIMTKSEILSYLDFFISQKQSQHKYEKAIEKWNKDSDFVSEYKAGTYTTVGVKGIHRKY